MSKIKMVRKTSMFSWNYLCDFYPQDLENEDVEQLKVIEERDKFENVVWTDKEFVDKVRSKCPNCGLLDRLLLCLCGKWKLKVPFKIS